MKTELKDILYLMVGQTLRIDLKEEDMTPNTWSGREYGDYELIGFNNKNELNLLPIGKNLPIWYKFNDKKMKLIIRPISDMNESEALAVGYSDKEEFLEMISECHGQWRISTSDYLFLLRQGFDLFDLIPNGFAIDKTTIKLSGSEASTLSHGRGCCMGCVHWRYTQNGMGECKILKQYTEEGFYCKAFIIK
jgi:hypothetical protein